MIFKENSKIVMIGDSITDCGRLRPIGEGKSGAYGDGYVNMVNAFLNVFYPEKNLRIFNMGISGNTVRDLKERWENDVLQLQPDYLSIMIGINDVWRQLDSPLQTERHVSIDEYEKTLENLVTTTKGHVKQIILISPYVIEPNINDAMRQLMDAYRAVVYKIANKYQTIYVDTQKAFDEMLSHYYSGYFAWDRIHPNSSGHLVIAKTFLNEIGFKWN